MPVTDLCGLIGLTHVTMQGAIYEPDSFGVLKHGLASTHLQFEAAGFIYIFVLLFNAKCCRVV